MSLYFILYFWVLPFFAGVGAMFAASIVGAGIDHVIFRK